ncbi:MAG: ATP-binding cassette domain-containing protein [Cylindrospermopsis raciborskii]|uniref:ATP-binding cassette domain-containing protein n=1 Tax=Cylindrospermopsis raciborskii TaxID=77022 RepID=UPI003D0D1507
MSHQNTPDTVIAAPRIELKSQGRTLEFILDRESHILGRAGDLVVPQDKEWKIVSRIQATLRREEGGNYRIYDGDGNKGSSNGIFVLGSQIPLSEGFLLTNGSQLQISLNRSSSVEITYFNYAESSPVATPLSPVYLRNKSTVIGRHSQDTPGLDSPIVSRVHATIDSDKNGYFISDENSKNGTFINDKLLKGKYYLKKNDKIRIGPYILVFDQEYLRFDDTGTYSSIRLDVKDLVLETKGKTRINKLSFSLEPGQLVALVGGSGAGKSTLMRTLLGTEKPTKGGVYINTESLENNFNLYRNQIGYVPQDDIIHLDLSVIEVLTYGAKLRLPKDVNLKELEEIVKKVLHQVEMTAYSNTLIKYLSGGQRKRVSIAVELLADPKLFFLDEPTSGLDPGLDKKMMHLLKDLAHEGNRTIILVTHATANINACDRIVFLRKKPNDKYNEGCELCYFGTPEDALDFFEVQDFSDIYIELEPRKNVVNYPEKFKESTYYTKYIRLSDRLSDNKKRKQKPQQKKISFWQQLPVLIERCYKLTYRDLVNLFLSLLTAPVAIILVAIACRTKKPFDLSDPDPMLGLSVLFVFTCAGLWVGFSSSLQEIVKESAIYLRERLVNLGLSAYLGSKVFTLTGLALVQALLVTVVILLGFQDPTGDLLIPWSIGLWINSFITLFSSFCLGLLVSAMVKNSTQANGALPLLILPQTIFAGVLFKLHDDHLSKILSWLTISRWSIGGYGVILNISEKIPEQIYKKSWENLSLNWGMLLLHSVVYLILTFWIQKRKDIFK